MGVNILVVDDEKELADVIELYLKNDGCNVYKFYTGGEALTCIENTQLDLAIWMAFSFAEKSGKRPFTPLSC